jgi:dGTPase
VSRVASPAGAERERPEEPCPFRTPYARDRDRILHAKAFRRLKHKTQVFVAPEGDHYRTRLTHTLEVSALSRTVARALGLDEDLVEAIAMGHDLGHAPFGHAGEEALDRELRARTDGARGFAHNLQSVRVVEHLERDGAGLNLTRAVRDGIRHHTGPGRPATPEGQVVRLMDRVAYVNHDIDDALRAGVLSPADLPAEEVALLGATTSGRLTTLVGDVIESSRVGDDLPAEEQRIAQSPEVGSAFLRLRRFMFQRVYLAPPASVESDKAQGVVSALFGHYAARPEALPPSHEPDLLTRVADHVSGMTDRYALRVFRELFTPRERPI